MPALNRHGEKSMSSVHTAADGDRCSAPVDSDAVQADIHGPARTTAALIIPRFGRSPRNHFSCFTVIWCDLSKVVHTASTHRRHCIAYQHVTVSAVLFCTNGTGTRYETEKGYANSLLHSRLYVHQGMCCRGSLVGEYPRLLH